MQNTNKFRTVEYTRSFAASRETPVLLLGSSQWAQDLELILEDDWKRLQLCTQETELPAAIERVRPKVYLLESGLWGGAESRLLDAVIPKKSARVLLASRIADELSWRRAQRSAAQKGVLTAVFDSDSRQAALEVTALLDGLVNSGAIHQGEALDRIRAALDGFRLSRGGAESPLERVAGFVLSHFAIPALDLEAGLLLIASIEMWRMPMLADAELSFAYQQVLAELTDQNIKATMALVNLISDPSGLSGKSEAEWASLLRESGFGKLAVRKLSTHLPRVREILLGRRDRALKVA